VEGKREGGGVLRRHPEILFESKNAIKAVGQEVRPLKGKWYGLGQAIMEPKLL